MQGYKLNYFLICAQLLPDPAGPFIHRLVKQESKFFEKFSTEYNIFAAKLAMLLLLLKFFVSGVYLEGTNNYEK